MTALDWPKEPGQDSLVKLLTEESGVSPELARVLEKESLGLELEREQEQELVGKQQEPEQKKEQEKEQELVGKQREQEQKKGQEKEKGKEPQGAWEGLDMASEVEWLVLKVRVLLDRSLQSQA